MNPTPSVFTRSLLSLFLLALLFVSTGCSTVAPWYRYSNRRPYPSKRYTSHWCFELPQKQVSSNLYALLKKAKFEFVKADVAKGVFVLKPASVPQYSRNINYGYELTLKLKTDESRGKLDISRYPAWSLNSGNIPKPDARKFKMQTLDGLQKYQAELQKNLETQASASRFMKKWKGCNVLKSTIRTRVLVDVKVMRFPYGPFNTFERRSGKTLRSDLTMEMALIRALAQRLKRRGPRLLYY